MDEAFWDKLWPTVRPCPNCCGIKDIVFTKWAAEATMECEHCCEVVEARGWGRAVAKRLAKRWNENYEAKATKLVKALYGSDE